MTQTQPLYFVKACVCIDNKIYCSYGYMHYIDICIELLLLGHIFVAIFNSIYLS